MSKATLITTLFLIFFSGQLLGQGFRGDEFQVNSYTSGHQDSTAIATAPDGSFVVVWTSSESAGTDHDEGSIQAQRFSSQGEPLGAQFQVNTQGAGSQEEADIAMNSAGEFVVVWHSIFGPDSAEVWAQRFSSSGTPLGSSFQCGGGLPSTDPSVAYWDNGSFTVVRTEGGQFIEADSFDPSGRFILNFPISDAVGTNAGPSISVSPSGKMMVVWRKDHNIAGRLYDLASPISAEFVVNDLTVGNQRNPEVTSLANDSFAVVWESETSVGDDSEDSSIQYKIISASGPDGSQHQANSNASGYQWLPAISSAPGSSYFTILWQGYGSGGDDSDGTSIQARRFSRSNGALGEDFQVNSSTQSDQWAPAVSVGPSEAMIATWTHYPELKGQLFGGTIFGDGFESGDLSKWSSSSP